MKDSSRTFWPETGRRDFSLVLALALTGAACKGRRNAVVRNEEDTKPQMASVVRMGDPKVSAQLVSGFYGIESSWRWTAGKFSVLLLTPFAAAQRGATLTFVFSVPDAAIQKFGKIALTASINGTVLKTIPFDKAGANVYTADVPQALLSSESVKIDFALDKTLPPDVDKRELGVIATSAGLSIK